MDLVLRPLQESALEKCREAFRAGHKAIILYGPTGFGKCHGIDTPIIMSDGSIKLVQDVEVGDKLMGPDGSPRNVISLGRGRGKLYRVTQKKGDSYVINSDHILSLKATNTSHGMFTGWKNHISKNADIVNINVEEFLQSSNTVKHCLKGWKSSAIELFDRVHDEEEILIPPYILGVWLGDGTSTCAAVTKPICNMTKAWLKYGESMGYGHSISLNSSGCPTWRLTNGRDGSGFNTIQSALSILDVLKNKHIPDSYKFAPIKSRLELLAGLIDSDGHLSHNGFDWISKYEGMATDFAFICRSVGLSCALKKCIKGIRSTGFSAEYWRCTVSGDTDKIPTLDKKAGPRKQKKRHLINGIEITFETIGDYYGFEIDGDKLYLLGDFTVTHNTELSIALLKATSDNDKRSAIVLDRIVLCNQTSKRLDKYRIDHGIMQSGSWRYRPYEKIQVCSAQTLEKRGSFPGLDLLIIDECHDKRKETIAFIKNNPHIRTIGLSASPFTKGLGDTYSHVVSATTTKELVDGGWLVPLRVYIAKEIDMKGAKKVAGEWSQDVATERGIKITGDIVAEWVKKTHEIFGEPRRTVVFCSGVAHGKELSQRFMEQGYNFVNISYQDDDEYKQQVIEEFNKTDSEIQGLIATNLISKGFDNAQIEIMISARPFSKSFSSHIQQLGRGIRSYPGKEFCVLLDHSGNYLRFRNQWDDLYENGVSELEEGGSEKAAKEPTEREKKESCCPRCHQIWPTLRTDICPTCGFKRERKSTVEAVAGEMVELTDNKIEKYPSEYKKRIYHEQPLPSIYAHA